MSNYIPLMTLMARCWQVHVIYCRAGGHYCVRLDENDPVCPMGCNT